MNDYQSLYTVTVNVNTSDNMTHKVSYNMFPWGIFLAH